MDRRKRLRSFVVKLAVGIIGIVVLLTIGHIDFRVLLSAADRPELLTLAFLSLLATVPLAAVRWWLLLRSLDFAVGVRWTVNITFISLFFHTFLPGAYGGDLVRLGLAYRATGGKLNRLTCSVLADRISGLVALLLLSLLLVPVLPEAYASRLEWVAAIAFVAGLAGLAVVLFWGDGVVRLLGALPKPVGPLLARIAGEGIGALRAYITRPAVLAAAVAISIVQYALVLAALIALGWAMRFTDLPIAGYLVAGIWSLVANALPVTPGGLGVGEAAFAHVALIFAPPQTAGQATLGTIFLAMRVLSIVIGVIGVLPWLLNRVDVRGGIAAMRAGAPADAQMPAAK
jgi:Predicted integral membrane protein